VSKDFDTTLSAAIDLAAEAAQTAGASAARIRGRQRTVRKRIAISTVSAVFVVVGATAAFKLASPHDGAPQLTATSPLVTATTTAPASPSPSADPRATTSPSASSSSSSGTITPSTSTSGSPSSNPAGTADPHHVVPGAWLAAAQLPFAGTFHWKAVQADPQGSSPIGQPLTATVFYVAKDTPFQALTTCADPTNLLGRTTGAQHTEYTATAAGSSNTASQFVFFFADSASAQQAFTWLQSQYSPSCATGDMTTTKGAGDGQSSAAWFSVKGASGPIDAPAYTREYFVLRGSAIAYVSVSSGTGNLPMTHDGDAAQLSTIAAHLCVYGGPCS
jgi:hypothetical protein